MKQEAAAGREAIGNIPIDHAYVEGGKIVITDTAPKNAQIKALQNFSSVVENFKEYEGSGSLEALYRGQLDNAADGLKKIYR